MVKPRKTRKLTCPFCGKRLKKVKKTYRCRRCDLIVTYVFTGGRKHFFWASMPTHLDVEKLEDWLREVFVMEGVGNGEEIRN